MKRRAKETQEELALDMKLLEQMLTETSNEAKEDLERKVALIIISQISVFIPLILESDEKRTTPVSDILTGTG